DAQIRSAGAVEINRISLAGNGQAIGRGPLWSFLHSICVRRHLYEFEAFEEGFENLKLPAQGRPAAAGLLGGKLESSIGMIGGEGIIQVIVNRAAGEQELPGFLAVVSVGGSFEAGLVVCDDFV